MPRIRTFKPEFFRSPDTAKASPEARLLFMALWSWADDEGIGETNLYGLLGFAFPDEDELTVKDLQRLLKEIGGSYGVVFYTHHGRFYYAIPSWNEHQKTERRANCRNPKPDHPDSQPDQRFGTSSGTQGNSSTVQGGSVPGTGEQGNIGTGENGGSETEVSHQSADNVAPPHKCPQHINNPFPPSCGFCADARLNFEAWKRNQQQAEKDDLERRRTAKATAAKAQIDCKACDSEGWVLGPDGTPLEPGVKCNAQHRAEASTIHPRIRWSGQRINAWRRIGMQ
jgi:hypothetical protein